MKSERRRKAMEAKRQQKKSRMSQAGAQSNYARKRVWCHRNGVWGFDVPFPKPWKSR